MAEQRKTQRTEASVEEFLSSVTDERRRDDAEQVLALIQEVTGDQPRMWGPSMIGFGTQPYTTADGKQHEWFAVGLSPRKASLTLYGLTAHGSHQDLLEQLGPHATGKGCLYLKRLSDVNERVLRALVQRAWDETTGAD